MQIRVIKKNNNNRYDTLSYADVDNYAEYYKMLLVAKENNEALMVNTANCVDTDGEYYTIEDVNIVVPSCGSDILPHISVSVEDYC